MSRIIDAAVEREREADDRDALMLSRARSEGFATGIEAAARACDERKRKWRDAGDASAADVLARVIRHLPNPYAPTTPGEPAPDKEKTT